MKKKEYNCKEMAKSYFRDLPTLSMVYLNRIWSAMLRWTHLPISPSSSPCLPACLSVCLSIYLSVCLSIYLSISIYLCVCVLLQFLFVLFYFCCSHLFILTLLSLYHWSISYDFSPPQQAPKGKSKPWKYGRPLANSAHVCEITFFSLSLSLSLFLSFSLCIFSVSFFLFQLLILSLHCHMPLCVKLWDWMIFLNDPFATTSLLGKKVCSNRIIDTINGWIHTYI